MNVHIMVDVGKILLTIHGRRKLFYGGVEGLSKNVYH